METTTTNRTELNLTVNTYRWGVVTMQQAMDLREAEEAAAKAKVARTGEPVTRRINVGMYDVHTTSGHYRIERELDPTTEEPTGWWIVVEYVNGFDAETGLYFRTLRDAKAHVANI